MDQHELRLCNELSKARHVLGASGFGKAAKLLSRYTRAVAEEPSEPKYRRIFGSNPTLVKRLGACPELLLACGWSLDGASSEACYVYPGDIDGSVARCTLQVLSRAAEGVIAASRPSAPALAERSLAQTNAPLVQVKPEPSKPATKVQVKQERTPPRPVERDAEQAEAAAAAEEWEQATRLAAAAERRANGHQANVGNTPDEKH
eukprot:COSAG03_NODE_5447_length_1247_cov_36.331352_2_plen_203_part_01